MNSIFQIDHLTYAIPPFLTFLSSIFLAMLTFQAGRTKRENQLFTIFCILQAMVSLEMMLTAIISSPHIALSISRIDHFFYIFTIPVGLHFVLEATGLQHRKKTITSFYIFSLVLVPFTQTNFYYYGMNKYFFGFLPKGGPAFVIFGLIGIFATLYATHALWTVLRKSNDPTQKMKVCYVLAGVLINAALMVGNILPIIGIEIYPPGNFCFIPMGLMAYGLLQHKLLGITKEGLTKDFIPRILIIFVWLPLILGIILWTTAKHTVFYPNILDRIYPYAIPSILSFLSCFILATISFTQRPAIKINILFGSICTLWGFLNLDITLNMLLTDKDLALQISQLSHFFLVNQLGLSVHFVYSITGRQKRWPLIYLFYIVGIFLMPLTQTHWYFQGIKEFPWGFYAQRNIGFDIFGFATFIAISWGIFLLYKVGQTETDVDLKKKYHYVLIGIIFTAILNLCSLPTLHGLNVYPLGNFTFLPVLIIGYGIFQHDIVNLTIYTKRRIWGRIVQLIILSGFIAILVVGYWAIGSFEWNYIYNRIIPYGIPPLLSVLCCGFLVTMAIKLGEHQKEAMLFSLLCMLFMFLNADILFNQIVTDKAIGLQISRWNHLFLVFGPALNFHLTCLVLGLKSRRWMIYSCYGLSLIFSPLTQTSLYLSDMHQYPWGFFAKGDGILFGAWGFLSISLLSYILYLLIYNYFRTENALQRHRILYLSLGFGICQVLTSFNLLPMKGYDFYPLGNFTFIPLSLMAFGLFKQNLKEALILLKSWLFYIGLIVVLVGATIALKIYCPTNYPLSFYFVGLIIILFVYQMFRFFWSEILLLFFGNEKEQMDNLLSLLLDDLSRQHSIRGIHHTVSERLFENLLSSSYAMLLPTSPEIPDQSETYFPSNAFSGWKLSNPKQGLFSGQDGMQSQENDVYIEPTHPLLPIFEMSRTLVSREQVEEWILIHKINLEPNDALLQAEIIMPVYLEGHLSSLLLLGEKIDGTLYANDEKNFLKRITLALGPYLENAKLLQSVEKKVEDRTFELKQALNETQIKEQEIVHISKVVQTVNSTLDINIILPTFENALKDIFDFNQIGIFLVDHKTNDLKLSNFIGKGITEEKIQAFNKLSFPLKEGLSLNADTVLKNKPIYFPELSSELMKFATPIDQQVMAINHTHAMLICPIEVQQKVIGSIVFTHTDQVFQITESEISKIQRYISHIASAINNARLAEETRRALEETKAKERQIYHINQMVQAVNSTLNLDEVMATVMKVLQDIFSFDQIGIFLADDKQDKMIFSKYYGEGITEDGRNKVRALHFPIKPQVSFVCECYINSKSFYFSPITSDLLQYFLPTDKALYKINPVKSYLLYPIQVQNKVIGTLVFADTQKPFTLSKSEIETIQQYVSQIATAIHNAGLAEQTKLALEETKAKEQEIAHINQVVQAVNSTLDLDVVMKNVMDALQEIFLFDVISIQLANYEEQTLNLYKAYGKLIKDHHLKKWKEVKIALDDKNSVSTYVFKTKQPFYINGIDESLLLPTDKKIYDIMPFVSILILPVELQNQAIGCICFFSGKKEFELTESDISKIQRYVSQIATAINNANLYKEVDKSRSIAEAATKSKSAFLANMSHEIRTPMNAILGFSQLMLRDPAITLEQQQRIETISRSGEHLLALINDILEMSKIEAGRITINSTTFDLHALLHDIEMMFRIRTDAKRLQFFVEPTKETPQYVITDEGKLRQILINLIGNAVKFTDTGGIAVRVRVAVEENEQLSLVAEVEDTGPGISPNDIDMLFQAFQQTETGIKAGGTGLGLALSREFARLLGGDITVTSQSGHGSCFRVVIGIKEGEGGMEVEHHAKRQRRVLGLEPGQDACRVLIVDDKIDNRLLLHDLLVSIGFEIQEAENGEEAIAVFQSWSPHIILMDMRMPVMDGYTATSRIKAMEGGKQTPIVAFTASAFEEEREKVFEAGADKYMRKPFKEYELLELLESYLGVRYIYETDPVSEVSDASVEDLTNVPEELLEEMRMVTTNLDVDRLNELIEQARQYAPSVVDKLRKLADNFAFDDLHNLLKKED